MIYKVTTTRKPPHTGIDAPRTAAYHTSSPNSPSLSTDSVTVQRIHNFSAGPAVLPEPVLSAAREHLLSLGETGIGILEHSHRGDTFGEVLSSAETRIRRLANIPDDVAVLFLQGGASLQFAMVPANLRPANTIADYIISGTWSLKAMEAAQSDGAVHVASSSQDSVFRSLPGPPQCSDSPAYLHYTSNNTIAGTQFSTPPNPPRGVPLVCDASSDIFSRPIDLNAHDLVYAGAQKNLGPAGLTLVMIRRTLLDTAVDSLPAINRYITHANAGSLDNTPPVFNRRTQPYPGVPTLRSHRRQSRPFRPGRHFREIVDERGVFGRQPVGRRSFRRTLPSGRSGWTEGTPQCGRAEGEPVQCPAGCSR